MVLSQIVAQEDIISMSFSRMSPFDRRVGDASVVEDLMIHDIDVLNSLATSPIKKLCAQGAVVFSDKLDFAQALISFENGSCASLTASRVTETKIRKAEINCKNAFILVDYLNRTVEISRKTNFVLDIGYDARYRQDNIVEKVFVPIAEPLRNEFSHFAECILTNAPIMTNGNMAIAALEICEQIGKEARALP